MSMDKEFSASQSTKCQRSSLVSWILKGTALFFGFWVVVATLLFWIYGTQTQHANRNSIWWTARGRGLIPPGATDISLEQDFLDHYATYKITEKDLKNFLNQRFAEDGHGFSSERRPIDPKRIDEPLGRLDWVVPAQTVVYSCYSSNGTTHTYYHDPKTGQTYQESAYW